MNHQLALMEALGELETKQLSAQEKAVAQMVLIVQSFMKEVKQSADFQKPFEEWTVEEICLALKIDGAAA